MMFTYSLVLLGEQEREKKVRKKDKNKKRYQRVKPEIKYQ